MPPPLIRACLAAWAERVSMMKPRSPSSRIVPRSFSSSRHRRRLGPVRGWLLRSRACRERGRDGNGQPGEGKLQGELREDARA